MLQNIIEDYYRTKVVGQKEINLDIFGKERNSLLASFLMRCQVYLYKCKKLQQNQFQSVQIFANGPTPNLHFLEGLHEFGPGDHQ